MIFLFIVIPIQSVDIRHLSLFIQHEYYVELTCIVVF